VLQSRHRPVHDELSPGELDALLKVLKEEGVTVDPKVEEYD
jgi:hypothetical protein